MFANGVLEDRQHTEKGKIAQLVERRSGIEVAGLSPALLISFFTLKQLKLQQTVNWQEWPNTN